VKYWYRWWHWKDRSDYEPERLADLHPHVAKPAEPNDAERVSSNQAMHLDWGVYCDASAQDRSLRHVSIPFPSRQYATTRQKGRMFASKSEDEWFLPCSTNPNQMLPNVGDSLLWNPQREKPSLLLRERKAWEVKCLIIAGLGQTTKRTVTTLHSRVHAHDQRIWRPLRDNVWFEIQRTACSIDRLSGIEIANSCLTTSFVEYPPHVVRPPGW
jgi:hypothetical protein